MNKNKEFDNILDECLSRLIEGETVASCLSRFPEYAAELEPLLRTAQETLKTAAVDPRPEFRDRARYQFQAAIRDMATKPSRGFFSWIPQWATAVSVVAAILIAGGGTLAAAGGSLPDSPLYQVKLAAEAVRVALTPSDLAKAELHAEFADERVGEIIKMAEKGNITLVEATTDRMNEQLIAVANLTGIGQHTRDTANFRAMNAPAPVTPTAMPTTTPALTPTPTPSPTGTLTAPLPTPAPTITLPPTALGSGTGPEKKPSVRDRETVPVRSVNKNNSRTP